MCMNTHPCTCAAWSCHVSLYSLNRLKNEDAKIIYKIVLKDEMMVIFWYFTLSSIFSLFHHLRGTSKVDVEMIGRVKCASNIRRFQRL